MALSGSCTPLPFPAAMLEVASAVRCQPEGCTDQLMVSVEVASRSSSEPLEYPLPGVAGYRHLDATRAWSRQPGRLGSGLRPHGTAGG
jgi:hypothetical protein